MARIAAFEGVIEKVPVTVNRRKSAAAIAAINPSSGGKNDKAAALAAANVREITVRPCGTWKWVS